MGFDGKRLEVGLMDSVTEKWCPVAPDLQFYDSYIRSWPTNGPRPLSKGFISRLLLERGSNGCSDRKVLSTSPRLSVLRFLNDYNKDFVVHTCPMGPWHVGKYNRRKGSSSLSARDITLQVFFFRDRAGHPTNPPLSTEYHFLKFVQFP